jgi:hypothetical protein
MTAAKSRHPSCVVIRLIMEPTSGNSGDGVGDGCVALEPPEDLAQPYRRERERSM